MCYLFCARGLNQLQKVLNKLTITVQRFLTLVVSQQGASLLANFTCTVFNKVIISNALQQTKMRSFLDSFLSSKIVQLTRLGRVSIRISLHLGFLLAGAALYLSLQSFMSQSCQQHLQHIQQYRGQGDVILRTPKRRANKIEEMCALTRSIAALYLTVFPNLILLPTRPPLVQPVWLLILVSFLKRLAIYLPYATAIVCYYSSCIPAHCPRTHIALISSIKQAVRAVFRRLSWYSRELIIQDQSLAMSLYACKGSRRLLFSLRSACLVLALIRRACSLAYVALSSATLLIFCQSFSALLRLSVRLRLLF